jgi:dienelactone hydrolase
MGGDAGRAVNKSITVIVGCWVFAMVCGHAVAQTFGPRAAEEAPLRRQSWLVPSPDPATPSRAILFRPAGDGPFPLAVIAHASTQSGVRRLMMVREPEYPALAAVLVAHGFAVLVPQRPGHGPTGGPYLEDQDGCDEADYDKSGRVTAEAIRMAMAFMERQPFIRPGGVLLIGHSAGGWGALAMAADDPATVSRIIAFAPGRGGQPGDRPNVVCAPDTLIATAAAFGRGAHIPVTWIVSENDTFFAPAFARQLADAFRAGGDKVDFRLLPPSGGEGHWLAEREEAGARLAEVLDAARKPPARGSRAQR